MYTKRFAQIAQAMTVFPQTMRQSLLRPHVMWTFEILVQVQTSITPRRF